MFRSLPVLFLCILCGCFVNFLRCKPLTHVYYFPFSCLEASLLSRKLSSFPTRILGINQVTVVMVPSRGITTDTNTRTQHIAIQTTAALFTWGIRREVL